MRWGELGSPGYGDEVVVTDQLLSYDLFISVVRRLTYDSSPACTGHSTHNTRDRKHVWQDVPNETHEYALM